MTLADSLIVSLIGFAVVFLVLMLLSFLIKVQSEILNYFSADKNKFTAVRTAGIETKNLEEEETTPAKEPENTDAGWSAGELKLLGVDDKTAAMIMAIVSDESKIPLSELQFKMIKAID